jgi:hypothetical protein
MSPLPPTCQGALAHIEADPLRLPAAVEAHVDACPACAEARVAWLVQEEAGPGQAPAGYFQALPGRVLAKLPAAPRRLRPLRFAWAAAAALLLAVGAGGFYAGRHPAALLVEASRNDEAELLPEALFTEGDEDLARLGALPPEEAERVLARMEARN